MWHLMKINDIPHGRRDSEGVKVSTVLLTVMFGETGLHPFKYNL